MLFLIKFVSFFKRLKNAIVNNGAFFESTISRNVIEFPNGCKITKYCLFCGKSRFTREQIELLANENTKLSELRKVFGQHLTFIPCTCNDSFCMKALYKTSKKWKTICVSPTPSAIGKEDPTIAEMMSYQREIQEIANEETMVEEF